MRPPPRLRRPSLLRVRGRAAAVAGIALLTGALLSGCSVVAPPSQAAELLGLVNQARSAPRSCGSTAFAAAAPLTLDARLTRAAQLHSRDMEATGNFSHTGSDGSTVGDRATAQGYAWSRIGEDIAAGFGSSASVMDAWLNSPGHCANIMDPKFRDLGTGVAGAYWTLDFGTPR